MSSVICARACRVPSDDEEEEEAEDEDEVMRSQFAKMRGSASVFGFTFLPSMLG